MPVSLTPILLILIFVLALIIAALNDRKALVRTALAEAVCLVMFLLYVYAPALWLLHAAKHGDPKAQYELSRWYVNNYFGPDTERSFEWLNRSANAKYPEALYALGIQYKYGDFVPQPANWNGPSGNWFPQPEKGQALIDEALRLGFKPPPGVEEQFYAKVYRK
jgi:TPR repeat protein